MNKKFFHNNPFSISQHFTCSCGEVQEALWLVTSAFGSFGVDVPPPPLAVAALPASGKDSDSREEPPFGTERWPPVVFFRGNITGRC